MKFAILPIGLLQAGSLLDSLYEQSQSQINNGIHNLPHVTASPSVTIPIELEDHDQYYGPLYIGSSFENCHVIYDTMSPWTTVNVASAVNHQLSSDYDPFKSTSDYPIFHDVYSSDGEVTQMHEQATEHLGQVQLSGYKNMETMCLKQTEHRSERSL